MRPSIRALRAGALLCERYTVLMRQEIHPSVVVVAVVVMLVLVGFVWMRFTGQTGTGSNPENNPMYRAYEQGLKKKKAQ